MKKLVFAALAAVSMCVICGCKTDDCDDRTPNADECDNCHDCCVEFPSIVRWWK